MEKIFSQLLEFFVGSPVRLISSFIHSLPTWFLCLFSILLIICIGLGFIASLRKRFFYYYFGDENGK